MLPQILGHRVLSEEETKYINAMKASANSIGAIIESMERDPGLDQRWVSIAKTHLQQGFMCATRAIGQPEGF